jgi:hypothetical protein
MSGGTSRLMQTIVLVVVARVPIPIAASLFSRSGTRAKRRLAALIAYLCSGLLAICATTLPAHAAHRVALVIGNSDYINTIPLANPSNDANDIAKSLRALGFEVILGNNLDRKDTEDALQRFARATRDSDAAVFFYSGHGMQFNGRNYLVPVDAKLQDEVSVRYEMTSTDDVREALQGSHGPKIMILDACRNNPLADKLQRSMSTTTRDIPVLHGFSAIPADDGMLVEYATQPNRVAEDGTSHNSPFTTALLKHIQEPNVEIATMLRRVGNDVYKDTNGLQNPELSVSLHSDFYLNSSSISTMQSPVVSNSAPLPAVVSDALPSVPAAPAWAPIKVASAPADKAADPSSIVRAINIELRRIGCFSGSADADWASTDVKRAVADVMHFASLARTPNSPSQEFLSFLTGQTDRLCPIVCSGDQTLNNGQCVAKVCGVNEIATPKGGCETVKNPGPIAAKEIDNSPRPSDSAPIHRLRKFEPNAKSANGRQRVVSRVHSTPLDLSDGQARVIPNLTPEVIMPAKSGGGGGGGGAGGGGGGWSDRRLKENIHRIGVSRSGLPIYTFQYIWGGPVYSGVMAQDMMRLRPDAVIKTQSGYMKVDYSRIDVKMRIVGASQ